MKKWPKRAISEQTSNIAVVQQDANNLWYFVPQHTLTRPDPRRFRTRDQAMKEAFACGFKKVKCGGLTYEKRNAA